MLTIKGQESINHFRVNIQVPLNWLCGEMTSSSASLSAVSDEPTIDSEEVDLGSFLCLAGIAAPITDLSSPSESTGVVTEPTSTCSSVTPQALLVSALTDSVLQIDEKCEFNMLVSHVVSPTEFFIHPLQEDFVKKLNSLEELLSNLLDDRSEKLKQFNKLASPQTDNSLCCVQHPEDQSFLCRGVVLGQEDQTNNFLIHLLDFGETVAVEEQSVFELPSELCDFPCLAIRCSLIGWESKATSDECKAFSSLIANKLLVGKVKLTGMLHIYCIYVCIYNYDTGFHNRPRYSLSLINWK